MNRINKIFSMIVMMFILSLSFITISYADVTLSGKGTQNDPYILDFNIVDSITVNYGKDKENFYFKIANGGKINGAYTYRIEKDDKGNVKFTKTNSRDVYVYTSDEQYAQAGAVPLKYEEEIYEDSGFKIISHEKNGSKYDIKFYSGTVKDAIKNDKLQIRSSDGRIIYGNINKPEVPGVKYSSGKSKSRSVVLANAPAEGGSAPSLKYFVLTPSGTAEALYGKASETYFADVETTEGTKNTNYIKRIVKNGENYVWEIALTRNGNECEFVTLCSCDKNGDELEKNGEKYATKDEYIIDVVYELKITKEDDKAGPIETAVTWLLLGLGEVFMLIIKLFLGSDLSMDSIIFNKYNDTILDLNAILYGSGPAAGILGNEIVVKVINTVYFGFQTLAIAAYIVMLLYIGIKVLMEVGGPKQTKWMRYIESWIMGVLILFIAPRFFHYITDISNSIVAYIAKDSKPYYSQYNISTMLDSTALYGENADTAVLAGEVEEGINLRKSQKDALNEKIATLNDECEKYFDERALQLDKYAGDYATSIEGGLGSDIAKAQREGNQEKVEKYQKLLDFFRESRRSARGMVENVKNFILDNRDALAENDPIVVAQYNEKLDCLLNLSRTYMTDTDVAQMIDDYYTRQVQIATVTKELDALQSYQSGGNNIDIMADMRVKAGKTGRLPYAIVWLSLIVQLVTLLSMYYKRILVVIILIMIFPIVMITYAIDKAGDGAAQTLETWFKEFTINILVQVMHAVIYVTLVDAGLQIYEADYNNWLFFFLAVLFIFPAERILRSIFGMSGSTIGNLNANLGGKLAAAGMVGSVAKNGARMVGKAAPKVAGATKNFVKDSWNNGLKNTISNRASGVKQNVSNKWSGFKAQNAKDKREAAKKARQAQSRADNRKNLRDSKIAQRRQKMEEAGKLNRARLKLMNAAALTRNGVYHLGNGVRKIKNGVNMAKASGVYKLAKGTVKTAGGIVRKAGGITAGVTDGVIKAGSSGLSAGIVEGISVGRAVGGFKSQPKPQKKPKVTSSSSQSHKPANMPGGQKALGATTKQVKKPGVVARAGAGGGKPAIKGVKKTTKLNKKIVKKTTITSVGNGNSNNNSNGNSH